MHACRREVQFIPALDGQNFIPWGQSSQDLSKDEMSDLLEVYNRVGRGERRPVSRYMEAV